MIRGDYVRTWFDTGACGVTIIYGRVVCAGPRTFTVRWESGLRNRIRQTASSVTLVAADDVDAYALARLTADEQETAT